MTERLAVIGYPLAHTLSPAIHAAAIRALGLDLTYQAVETPPNELAPFVSGLRGSDWLGCNVTVPHKQTVMPLLDSILPEADEIGAVNTIYKTEAGLTGANTDVAGFLADLEAHFGPVDGKRVAVLGAGGAAHAVCWSLRDVASEVWVVNRSGERAEQLARRFNVRVGGQRELQACQLIVNCTSAGLQAGESPVADEWIPAGVELYDLIYNPAVTRLMQVATERGGRAVNGLGMLVRQAAAAFSFWTRHEPPLDVMFRAAKDALGGSSPCLGS